MFIITDDIIINILMQHLEFCHFIQLRAVNKHLYHLITDHLEKNNQIIKKGTQLIILKGKFKIRGDELLPFTQTLRKYSITSQDIIDEFNRTGKGAIFKFSELEYAKTQTSSYTLIPDFNDFTHFKDLDRDLDKAVYCAKCKIDLIIPPNQLTRWNNLNGNFIGLITNEWFDLLWHYDFLTGIRVYVKICILM